MLAYLWAGGAGGTPEGIAGHRTVGMRIFLGEGPSHGSDGIALGCALKFQFWALELCGDKAG